MTTPWQLSWHGRVQRTAGSEWSHSERSVRKGWGPFSSVGELLSFSSSFLGLRSRQDISERTVDTASCLAGLWVCFLFQRTDGLGEVSGPEWIGKCFGGRPLSGFLGFSHRFALRPVQPENVQVKSPVLGE